MVSNMGNNYSVSLLMSENCDRCNRIAQLVKDWAAKQGHDSCSVRSSRSVSEVYYPEIFRQIASE